LHRTDEQTAPDEEKALWVRLFAFLEWVSAHRSDVLEAHAPDELRDAVDDLVKKTKMPPPPAKAATPQP
jgi:hypothetical protein